MGKMVKVSLKEAQNCMLNILIEVDRICKKHDIEYFLDSGTVLGAIRHKGFIPWDDDLDIGMLREDYNKFIKIVNSELNEGYVLQTPENDNKYELGYVKIRDVNSKIDSSIEKSSYNGFFIDIFPYDEATFKNKLVQKSFKSRQLIYWFSNLDYKKPFKNNIAKNAIISVCKLQKIFTVIYPFNKSAKNAYLKGLNIKDDGKREIMYGVGTPFEFYINREEILPTVEHEFEGHLFNVPKNYNRYLEMLYGEWKTLPDESERKPSHGDSFYINEFKE
ncbi:MAG: LicD family protein [Clostridium sp.]